MVQSARQFLFRNIAPADHGRVTLLSLTLFFIISGFWILRCNKAPLFSVLVGKNEIPFAKMMSLLVVLVIVLIYNFLLDKVSRHHMFYIIGTAYSSVLLVVTFFLFLNRTEVEAGEEPSGNLRWLGWILWFTTESYGSLITSLFWSFVNSTFSFEGAKSSYGLIISAAQAGSIIGPVLVTQDHILTIPAVFSVGAITPLCAAVMIGVYNHMYGASDIQRREDEKKLLSNKEVKGAKPRAGLHELMEGVILLFKHPYVFGIFIISCGFEITMTVLDYEMIYMGKQRFPVTSDFSTYFASFGIIINVMSLLLAFFGTGYLFSILSFRYVLMTFPSACLGAMVLVYSLPQIWVVFSVLVVLKSINFSVNNPSKEMLYSVTANNVKFKSKSWIDMFGARAMKALGSAVTIQWKDSMVLLTSYGSMISASASLALIVIAYIMGKTCEARVGSDAGKIGDDTPLTPCRLSRTSITTPRHSMNRVCGICEGDCRVVLEDDASAPNHSDVMFEKMI